MSRTLTPQFAIDEVSLDVVELIYRPTWNGSAWVVDIAGLTIACQSDLSFEGNVVQQATHIFRGSDFNGGNQNRLTGLYDLLEDEIVSKYP